MDIPRLEQFDSLRDFPEGATSIIETALLDSEVIFRSPQGIEGETGIPAAIVEAVLDLSPNARKSILKGPEGKNLYALADRPKTWRERVETVRWVLASHANALIG